MIVANWSGRWWAEKRDIITWIFMQNRNLAKWSFSHVHYANGRKQQVSGQLNRLRSEGLSFPSIMRIRKRSS
jgi:hypothetical protein